MRLIGFISAIGGWVLAAATWTKFGGVIHCGTWGLDCVAYAVGIALLTQTLAATLLFTSLVPEQRGTPANSLQILVAGTSLLAALASGGLVFFVFVGVASRG